MKHRLKIDQLIKKVCPKVTVYFQPPSKEMMQYPCILYEFDGDTDTYANNKKYRTTETYKITVMDRKPTSTIADAIHSIDGTKRIQHYCSGGITHDVFTLFL